MAVPAPNPFDALPIETCQQIATYLPDSSLTAYRLICHSTHDAVDADRCSFWRRRFLATFERPTTFPANGGNEKYKLAYQKRRKALMYGAKFDWAIAKPTGKDYAKEIRKGTRALEVLRDLIVDSFSEKNPNATDNDPVYDSPNLSAIQTFINNHDLLHCVLLPSRRHKEIHSLPKPLLHTILVLLAPTMLSLDYQHLSTYDFPTSQSVVYGTATDQIIFGGCNGLDVNMEWVLHHLNFWKYHMVREEEHTLYDAFAALDPSETPRFWNSSLKTSGSSGGFNRMGKYWKGSYAYVDRDVIRLIRNGKGADGLIQDEFNGEAGETGSFQDMRLDWLSHNTTEEEEEEVLWPPLFEKHLRSLSHGPAPGSPNRAKTRAQHRSASPSDLPLGLGAQNIQFTGSGYDTQEDFCASGWVNALPPQQGVPGWQRMTMMKYFEDAHTGEIDTEALWAYEGVVLPGGQIMVGRWWSPGDGTGVGMYSGPFILWCVDGLKYCDEKEGEGEEE